MVAREPASPGPATSSARSFPLNAWYAAAWSHEVKRELTPRTICNKDIVLYRRTDGQAAALEDACWHRLVPLSLGKLKGDDVQCGYHGIEFNSEGRCTFMPAQKTINPSACVRAFPIVERHRMVWVWPGDPALADPAKMPDFHWNDGTEWIGEGGTFYSLKCDYRLVIDNLMDLTHETYVHAGSIGHDAIVDVPFDVTYTDRLVTVTRWMKNIEAPPFWARQLGKQGHVDRWQIIRCEVPHIVVGDVGVAPAGTGAPEGDRSHGVNGAFLAALTPESETTCHYHWNFVRLFHRDDEELTRKIQSAHVSNGKGVYDEDVVFLEAQQRAIGRHPRQPFYNLNIDAGPMWCRRLIDKMVAEESPRPILQAAE